MAQPVIDGFKIVEIQEHDGEVKGRVQARIANDAPHPVQEFLAIRQSGQHVRAPLVRRQLLDDSIVQFANLLVGPCQDLQMNRDIALPSNSSTHP